jgi:hypothetical protein
VPFNKIGAFEMPIASTRGQLMILQCALLLIMDPQKPQDGFPFAQHPDFPRDQRKVVTIEGTSGKKQDTELILLTFIFPESEQSPLHGQVLSSCIYSIVLEGHG